MAEEPLTPDGQEPEQSPPAAPDSPEAEVPASAEGMAEEALQAAQEALSEMTEGQAAALELPAFGANGDSEGRHGIDLLKDVNLHVKIELGRTRMLVEDVLRLGQGSVVELDKLAGDPVDVYVNDRPVARGEVLVLNDNFCVRISEILRPVGEAPEE